MREMLPLVGRASFAFLQVGVFLFAIVLPWERFLRVLRVPQVFFRDFACNL